MITEVELLFHGLSLNNRPARLLYSLEIGLKLKKNFIPVFLDTVTCSKNILMSFYSGLKGFLYEKPLYSLE